MTDSRRADDTRAAPAARRRAVLFAAAVFAYTTDLITKTVAVDRLGDGDVVELFGGALTLRLIRNPGAAFGIGGGMTVVFSLVMLVVVAMILRAAPRVGHLGWAVALGLLLGGALGNFTDRLLRSPGPLRGRVVDFLELPHWPVFNVADSWIVVAGAMLVVLGVRNVPMRGGPRPQVGSRRWARR